MSLVDIDELALRCRDEQARAYIREAVACYKANAFRSCIVATWNAIVFDFLHKLRELDLTGDKKAKQHLEKFNAIRLAGEKRLLDALAFERDILKLAAEDFELLTSLEIIDLSRIQADRNRCAHPSMQSAEEPYEPTAELARTHLRNAVTLMLEREPVQGKAAFDLICSDVKSVHFPTSHEEAKTFFKHGLLKRAKQSLVSSLIKGITVSNLNENLPLREQKRQLAAIGGILSLYRNYAEEALKKDFNSIVSKVPDNRYWALIRYVSTFPISWEILNQAMRVKINSYVRSLAAGPGDERAYVIAQALCIDELREAITDPLKSLSDTELAKAISYGPHIEYAEMAIKSFAIARSFRDAEALAKSLIIPLATVFESKHIKAILDAAAINTQIYSAAEMNDILKQFYDLTPHTRPDANSAWASFIEEMLIKNPDTYTSQENSLQYKLTGGI